MAEWSIIPNDGASINSEGVATFQPNSGTTDREYIITYTDDNGCTGSTRYIVSACTDCQCTCDDLIFDNSQISLGYNETTREIPVSSSCGELTFQKNTDWINVSYANDKIIITANENAETDNRKAVIKVLQDGIECNNKSISIEQQGKPKTPRLVFNPGTDVYYSFEGKPDENSNLLRAGVSLPIDNNERLRVLIDEINDSYSIEAEDGDNHYVYIDVLQTSFPGQEVSSFYNCDEGKWYFADESVGDGSQECMQLGNQVLVACCVDEEDPTHLSTIARCNDATTAHFEITVSPQELLLNTYLEDEPYPGTEDMPFTMRAYVSETKYTCAGNRQHTPTPFKNDLYTSAIEFYVKK